VIQANGGVVLAMDGVQPQKGKPTLYIFRDALSGIRFHAASLWHNDTDSLVEEMRVVAKLLYELDVPLLGVVSDDQHAIRQGVAQVWPDIPHQLCHLHFLKAVQKPIYDEDSSLSKELKKRGVASVPLSAKSNNSLLKRSRSKPTSTDALHGLHPRGLTTEGTSALSAGWPGNL
jgi:hypothetical protein